MKVTRLKFNPIPQDFPCGKTSVPTPRCNLCRLQQVLALQIYAPLDNSKYHRTLYIFTCVNPNCWNQNESWTCIRVQSVEDTGTLTSASSSVRAESATSWLSDADDWGNDSNDNTSEQNGNNVPFYSKQFSLSTWNESLDDQDLNNDFSNLHVDDPNANRFVWDLVARISFNFLRFTQFVILSSPTGVESPTVGGGGGAVGRLDSPHASAEIEGEESEVICIDTPTKPQRDLVTLLHEVTPLPVQHVDSKEVLLTFTEIFISVEEEECNSYIPQHVRDLISEYQQSNPESIPNSPVNSGPAKDTETTLEKYEKGIPVHGDEMFHDFMSRLQMNPGQLLRYHSRLWIERISVINYMISVQVLEGQQCRAPAVSVGR